MSEEQEKNTPETSDEEETGEQETIEDTKTQLAEMYLNFLDKQKGGILGTAAGMGANFNPNQKAAIEYLTAQKKFKEKTNIFENLEKNMKSKFMEKLTGGTMLEYDKKSLAKMKALITQYKDDQAKLQELMTQIQEGTDPTMENITTTTPTSPEKPVESSTKVVSEKNVLVGGILLGGTLVDISQTDIDVITLEKEKIKADITGDFASIKKIKNSKGDNILEGLGESPYIHKDVRPDLLTLALLFYQKTGQALSISSAFRTHTHQEKLKKQKKDLAATPGYSGHEVGRSFDIDAKDRYAKKIGGIEGFKEIAKKCHFNPLKGEDRHFDHETLPKAEDRPAIAQVLDKEYEEEKLAA